MQAVAIIPCRAGSKGIPSKNRVELCGMPLFLWSVAAALAEDRIKTICITTDDKEILTWTKWAMSREKRIVAVERPSEMAEDSSPTEPCMFHACNYLGVGNHEYVVLMQPTSPLRSGNLLGRALDMGREHGSCFTCRDAGHIMWIKTGRFICPLYDPSNRPRRQDCADVGTYLAEDGNIYCSKFSEMELTKTRFGVTPFALLNDECKSAQIDTISDLNTIKAMATNQEMHKWMEEVRILLPR